MKKTSEVSANQRFLCSVPKGREKPKIVVRQLALKANRTTTKPNANPNEFDQKAKLKLVCEQLFTSPDSPQLKKSAMDELARLGLRGSSETWKSFARSLHPKPPKINKKTGRMQSYQAYARKSELEKLDHVAYLYELSKTEHEDRYNRRTERLLKSAKLPAGKRLDNFELSHVPSLSPSRVNELASGNCLDICENVLIFGNPGTGKTHLACSLAREWCLRGRHTFFTSAAALVQDLLKAKRDLKLNLLLKKLDKFALHH